MSTAVLTTTDSLDAKHSDRFFVGGVPIDVISEEGIFHALDMAVSQCKKIVLANMNLHGLYCALQSPEMLYLLQKRETVVHIDGTPVLWLARLFGMNVPEKARNTHVDLIPKLLQKCRDNGWPVVIVGSDPDGAIENQRIFSTMIPGLSIAAFEGYFERASRPAERQREDEVLKAIEDFQPKLLLVGMGMPRQEEWIARIYDRISSSVIMPVGGFADYFTGRTQMPPRYLGPLGLEWTYRFLSDPKRLWFRYMVEPVLLLGLLLKTITSGAAWGGQSAVFNKLNLD